MVTTPTSAVGPSAVKATAGNPVLVSVAGIIAAAAAGASTSSRDANSAPPRPTYTASVLTPALVTARLGTSPPVKFAIVIPTGVVRGESGDPGAKQNVAAAVVLARV